MRSDPQDKNFPATSDQLLNSLARELKNPLILIARQAELGQNTGDDSNLTAIRETAENTLRLIDSYLLMARSEYGQRSLPMESMAVGSIIYDVAKDLAPYAKSHGIGFSTDVKDGSVMANREGLRAVIGCLAELAMAQNTAGASKKEVLIRTKRKEDRLHVSILGNSMDINGRELEMARRMQGVSQLASGKLSDSGIRLAISDILAGALGSELKVRQAGRFKGLGFSLMISKQLQLV